MYQKKHQKYIKKLKQIGGNQEKNWKIKFMHGKNLLFEFNSDQYKFNSLRFKLDNNQFFVMTIYLNFVSFVVMQWIRNFLKMVKF